MRICFCCKFTKHRLFAFDIPTFMHTNASAIMEFCGYDII